MKIGRLAICSATKLIGIVAVALTLATSASANLTLPIGSDSSSDLVFNFDFTSVTPSPPYVDVIFFVTLDPTNAIGSVVIDLFGDLNGGTLLASYPTFAANVAFTQFSGDPRIEDGLFSIGLRATPGSFAQSGAPDAIAIALVCDSNAPFNCHTEQTSSVSGEIVQTSVPEPATLALFALGLTGLASTRRRRNHI